MKRSDLEHLIRSTGCIRPQAVTRRGTVHFRSGAKAVIRQWQLSAPSIHGHGGATKFKKVLKHLSATTGSTLVDSTKSNEHCYRSLHSVPKRMS